jgi:hypothetical protein
MRGLPVTGQPYGEKPQPVKSKNCDFAGSARYSRPNRTYWSARYSRPNRTYWSARYSRPNRSYWSARYSRPNRSQTK